jgi:hypothetical protein
MASDRCRRLARLERQLADEQYSWFNGRGLASLLAWDKAYPEPDDDDDGVYMDCAGASGLWGLLFHIP